MGLLGDLKKQAQKVAKEAAKAAERGIGLKTIGEAIKTPSKKNIGKAAFEIGTAATVIGIPIKAALRAPTTSTTYTPRPTPDSSPEDIRSYIDQVIGRNERDEEIVKFLTDTYPNFSRRLEVARHERLGHDPYTEDTMGALATKNMPGGLNLDPYSPMDSQIIEMLQRDERMATLYLRETDPSALLPYLPINITKKNSNLWGDAVDTLGDVFGRPIGGTLEALAWPSEQVVLFIGDKLVWNRVRDPWMRHELSRFAYDYGISQTDWNMKNPAVAAITQKANDLHDRGITGDDAWTELQPLMKENMSTRAAIFGFLASATLDPLWLLGPMAKGAGIAIRAAPGGARLTEATGLISKFPRVVAAGGRLEGQHTWLEILKAKEQSYQSWMAKTPPRGPWQRFWEQRPGSFASEVVRHYNNIFARADSITIDSLARYDDLFKSGLTPENAAMFGPRALDNPQLMRFAAYMKENGTSLVDEILGKGTRNQIEAMETLGKIADELGPESFGALTRKLVMNSIETLAMKEQEKYLGKFLTHRVGWVAGKQKQALGILSLAKPSFVPLNLASNTFHFLYDAARNPVRMPGAVATLFRSMVMEFTPSIAGRAYPAAITRRLTAHGLSPAVFEDIVHSGGSIEDILGKKVKGILGGEVDINTEVAALKRWPSGRRRTRPSSTMSSPGATS